MSPVTADAADADALTGEYAAVYAYGALGPYLTGAALALARQAELAHRDARDGLLETLTSPPAPAPFYDLPFAVHDATTALALAVLVEERCAALWRVAVAAADPSVRQPPLDQLTNAALRAASLRRAAGAVPGTVAFPGQAA